MEYGSVVGQVQNICEHCEQVFTTNIVFLGERHPLHSNHLCPSCYQAEIKRVFACTYCAGSGSFAGETCPDCGGVGLY